MLRQQLEQTEAERDRIRDELIAAKQAAEQTYELEQDREQLRRELADLRSQQPTPSLSLELPDAAELLNRLKSSNPKSKTTLRDVAGILEAIQGRR